ncbi:MAG: methylated-DNA--[protein]-cysteine S-methyltransferase [Nitrospirae bacterium]|nr:methylated-DNA--[protein]-cysteine S-methyltransferase [Nitrospirota bacterium]
MNTSQSVYDTFDSPLGTLYLTFSDSFLTAVSFSKPSGVPFKKGSAPESFIRELSAYFNGENSSFTQQIRFLAGTDFEKKVWSALNKIPFGETRSYKWLAGKIGKPAAARAVGGALSKNPIPIVIPCHRVIESDGSLGGYSSGVNVKKRLLEMEHYARQNRS